MGTVNHNIIAPHLRAFSNFSVKNQAGDRKGKKMIMPNLSQSFCFFFSYYKKSAEETGTQLSG